METETSKGKGSTCTPQKEDGSSLGLKLLQSTESFPYKKMMMMINHDRQIEGPTFCNGSSEGSNTRDIYDVGGGVGFSSVSRTLQPFNSTSAFKSPVRMAASLRLPFTSAQWQELERQALIFKYMMAAVPVPPDLLIPITRNLPPNSSYPSLGRGSGFNLRFSNGTDPEPGRCRRTDGKKWRCSRDVAPDQKYCERHMHRGRPRSRKHVEVQTEINNNPSSTITTSVPSTKLTTGTSRPYALPSGYRSNKPDFKVLPLETMVSDTPYKESRCIEWMFKGENVPMGVSNQDFQQLMQAKGNSTSSNNNNPIFQQDYQENLNLNSYTDFNTSGEGLETEQPSDNCYYFLNPELVSLEEPLRSDQRHVPRRFIDAWSTTARDNPPQTNKSNVSTNGKLSPSSLTLSMSGDNGVGEEMDQIQMGLGVIDNPVVGIKSQPLSWMTPASWIASPPPGGPLGEVLQSRNNTISRSSSRGEGLNLMTDDLGGNHDTSPPATTISSPSGVLQKTHTSLSDSSNSSSPTFRAAARPEIALQWMNQNKLS